MCLVSSGPFICLPQQGVALLRRLEFTHLTSVEPTASAAYQGFLVALCSRSGRPGCLNEAGVGIQKMT